MRPAFVVLTLATTAVQKYASLFDEIHYFG